MWLPEPRNIRQFEMRFERSRRSGLSQVRMLVLEDDPLTREFLVDALREAGFYVIHAADGEQALAWCGRKAADVLITDIRLPSNVDGWQIAERVREHNPKLPLFYATGFSPVPPRPPPG